MKSLFYLSLSLLCLVAVSTGCNEEAAEETAVTEVSAVGEAACCGSCSGETAACCSGTTAVSTEAPAKACCGQCAATTTVSTDAPAKECCGKCTATTTVSTAAEPCQKGCDACAKGDEANCKCDSKETAAEAPAEKPATDEAAQ